MADYMTQSVFKPTIPKHLINNEDRRIFEAYGITIETYGEDNFYLYADEWCCNGYLDSDEADGEEIELCEDDLLTRFQEIIRRSNGELPWISRESAYTCSRMRPDGFGGGAVFITADDIQYCFTGQWLEQRISEAETGNTALQIEEPPQTKPIVGIVIEGGLVQSIVSNAPKQLPDMDLIVIDYDVDGVVEEDSLLNVPQSSGVIARAVGRFESISEAGIKLEAVYDQMKERG